MGLNKYTNDFFKPLFEADNFVFIATNTTKYYQELLKNYGDRFSDTASLLATAGILDAQNYIFTEHTIDLPDVITMAKKSATLEEEALVDFITKLEIAIFQADNPDIDSSDIVQACIGMKEDITDAIQTTKKEYMSEPTFASVVSVFMNSPRFTKIRKKLNIKNRTIPQT